MAQRWKSYMTWLLLVWVNAVVGLLFNLGEGGLPKWAGIFLAVMTYVVIYSELELWFRRKNHDLLVRRLRNAAMVRLSIQIFYPVDMIVGVLSMGLASTIVGKEAADYSEMTFSGAYFVTMIHAAILSVFVAIIMALIEAFVRLYTRFTRSRKLA